MDQSPSETNITIPTQVELLDQPINDNTVVEQNLEIPPTTTTTTDVPHIEAKIETEEILVHPEDVAIAEAAKVIVEENKKKGPFAFLKKKKKQIELIDPNDPKIWYGALPAIWKVGPIWLLVIVGITGAVVGAVAPLAFFAVIGDVLDAIAAINTNPAAEQQISNFCVGIVGIGIIAGAFNWINQFFNTIGAEVMGTRLKKLYFTAAMRQEIAFFDFKKTGTLLAHLGEEIQKITEAMTTKLSLMLQFSCQGVIGIILAFVYAWKLALVMIAFAPLLIGVLMGAGWLAKIFATSITKINAECFAVATEVLGAPRTVKSMGGEEKEMKRYLKKFLNINLLSVGKGFFMGAAFCFISFAIWSICSLTFWYGAQLVKAGELTAGNIFTVFGVMLLAVMGITQAFSQFPELMKAMASANVLVKVIMRKPQINFKGGLYIQPEQIEGKVSFRNITFAYPTRPQQTVLKNFTLDVEPGKQVALVGASGSGKSTIVGLLERFYEVPEGGEILVDGHPIKSIDPFSLHKFIGIVTQEPVLFATSIKDNIAYARPEATQEEIEAAAKAANAHDFISRLPLGYNTFCGEKGVQLSGGQKQRIAIARVLIQNPRILLLDEATSALDTTSESIVQDAINKLMKGRTSIVIAHRLATIKNADEIIVMKHGEIVERGRHHDLLTVENGHYAALASKQLLFAQMDDSNPLAASEQSVQSTTLDVNKKLV